MISENLNIIQKRIREKALLNGRNPDDILLIAVSKTIAIPAIQKAILCGQLVFGENYIQEATQKKEALGEKVKLHLIGHLQSNKAKIAAQIFDTIQTVDSIKLATSLNRHLDALDRTLNILVQVNIGDDPNKSGVMPEKCEELLEQIKILDRLKTTGLMTIPPLSAHPEETRPHFRALRRLAEKLSDKGLFHDNRKIELSMGMSDDFEVAIEEGATMVRVGTAIFGQR